jgi:hypothetical protein
VIRGYLEAFSADSAQGWALDDADPTARLAVRILLGSRVIAHGKTSEPRQDLQIWGGGNYGFSLDFSAPLSEEEVSVVVAEAAPLGSDQWQFLPRFAGSPAAAVEEMVSPPTDSGLVTAAPARGAHWSDDPHRTDRHSEESLPVFITGSVRSGTSALFAALAAATRYRGFYEGHVLDLAAGLAAAVEAHFHEKHAFLPDAAIADFHLGRYRRDRFDVALRALLRQLARGFTTAFWADKTPSIEMVRSVPLLAQTWPGARVIFMMRRGLENVMSQQRKFPGASFEESCLRWANLMAEWRRVRLLIPGKFIEVEQRSLLDDPRGTAQQVGALLQLDDGEIAGLADGLARLRIEVTDPAARVIADFADTGWSDEMIAIFRRICGPEMEAYGYSYDGWYRRQRGREAMGEGRRPSWSAP